MHLRSPRRALRVDLGELGELEDIGGPDVTDADSENLGAPEPPSGLRPPTKSGYVRRLYDWMLHWADTPYGLPALAVLALAADKERFPTQRAKRLSEYKS